VRLGRPTAILDESVSSATALRELVPAWRARAADLRSWALADGAATALERAADELEAALHSEAEELLNLEQAAAASGFSADHLGREVRAGRIPNAGRPNAPRIRRADLPRKTGWLPPEAPPGHVVGARGRIARAVAHSTTGD